MQDQDQENMSWRKTWNFYEFEMSADEIANLAAAAIAILHVRWQWISA